eukprot:3722263-Amphidinium_carterae.1
MCPSSKAAALCLMMPLDNMCTINEHEQYVVSIAEAIAQRVVVPKLGISRMDVSSPAHRCVQFQRMWDP